MNTSKNASDILFQIQQLSSEDQATVFFWLAPKIASQVGQSITDPERDHIDSVLLTRDASHCQPLDDDFVDRVIRNGEAMHKWGYASDS